MNIHYDQIGQVCVTMLNPEGLSVGEPCEIMENDTICVSADGNDFHGIVIGNRGEYATVVLRGFVTVPYGAFKPSCGLCGLGSNEDGTVGMHSDCRNYLVTNVDETAKTVTFLM